MTAKKIKVDDVGELANKKQSTNESANNFREKMFKAEYSTLIKYYHDNTYKMIDESIRSYKKRVIKSQSPEIALAYIMATQIPLISYLDLRSKKEQSKLFEHPERLFENKDYAPFEEVIIKNGNYNQVKHALNCLGTNAVNMGFATYVKGKKSGKTDEQIKQDINEILEFRKKQEVKIINFTNYPNIERLEENCEKIKLQIEEAIIKFNKNNESDNKEQLEK